MLLRRFTIRILSRCALDGRTDFKFSHFEKVGVLTRGIHQSEFYSVAAGVNKGVAVQTLFSQTDEVYHDKLRRSLASAYSMSNVMQYEPFVDKTIEVFLEQMDHLFAGKEGPDGIVDLPQWMRAYSFDVIGELTYGERHGFLDSGGDVEGIVSSLRKAVAYGQMVSLIFVFSAKSCTTIQC